LTLPGYRQELDKDDTDTAREGTEQLRIIVRRAIYLRFREPHRAEHLFSCVMICSFVLIFFSTCTGNISFWGHSA